MHAWRYTCRPLTQVPTVPGEGPRVPLWLVADEPSLDVRARTQNKRQSKEDVLKTNPQTAQGPGNALTRPQKGGSSKCAFW